MSRYRVTGTRAYRTHQPGSMFEAVLEPAAESRAVTRGAIELIERSTPRLQEGSYTLPTMRQVKGGSTDA